MRVRVMECVKTESEYNYSNKPKLKSSMFDE